MTHTTTALATQAATNITIVSNEFTVTQNRHVITNSGTVNTITNGFSSQSVGGLSYHPTIILQADTGVTVTFAHEIDNISLSGDTAFVLTANKILLLTWDGSYWRNELTAAVGGGYNTIKSNDTPLTQRSAINFIDGAEITYTIADDAGNDETEITPVLGVVPITKGGTGSTNKNQAFAALAPGLNQGDLSYKDVGIYQALPIGTLGQRLIVVQGSPGLIPGWETPPGIRLLAGVETSDAASITISGWAAGNYRKLRLEVSGMRSDQAASGSNLFIQLNGDTGANYYYANIRTTGVGSPTTSEGIAATQFVVSQCISAANTDSNSFGSCVVHIYNSENTSDLTNVRAIGERMSRTSGQPLVTKTGGQWNSTAAVTSITLTPGGGTGFQVGNAGDPAELIWTLYGEY